jgi:ubiquinone/menaquinone biosynthesis C-methylase UbiE
VPGCSVRHHRRLLPLHILTEMAPMFPYFETLFEHFNDGDEIAQRSLGEHVHWGYWHDPCAIPTDPADFHQAAEMMVRQMVKCASIRDRMKVLDVGCGLGGTIKFLNGEYRNCVLFGVNIDQRQLRLARQNAISKNENLTGFVRADACVLPFGSDQFDVILCIESIFHFDDRETFLRECERVLRPGGKLVVSDFVPVLRFGVLFDCVEQVTHLIGRVYGDLRLNVSIARYRAIARASRLECLSIEDITFHTLPTYQFFKNRLIPTLKRHKGSFRLANFLIEAASRMGLLRYLVLTFMKPA